MGTSLSTTIDCGALCSRQDWGIGAAVHAWEAADRCFDPRIGRLGRCCCYEQHRRVRRPVLDLRRHNFSPNKLARICEVTVGTSEPHAVRIEKTREAHFAGFRRHTFKALVDGELVGEY
jgi:hypothetical protein